MNSRPQSSTLLQSAWCHSGAAMLALAVTFSTSADVIVPARFADLTPVIDGHVEFGEWDYSAATTLRSGEVVMYTKNDDRFLYLLLDARSDTSNDFPGYHMTVDVNRDGVVSYYRDFVYRLGLRVGGNQPPLLAKWPYEPLLPPPAVPTVLSADPSSQAAIGFETTWALGWLGPAHRISEFRLNLAELGLRPEDLRASTGIPSVRIRIGYSTLDEPFDPLNEPGGGGPTGFNNMFLIRLSQSSTYPAGTAGPLFQGVGRVPASAIDATLGTVFLNIPGYDYVVTDDAPFGGVLQVKVTFQLARDLGAVRYRVIYSADGGSDTVLRQRWTNLRATTEEALLFRPDAGGWYPIQPDIASADAWYKPNLAMEWNTAGFPDGNYRLRLEFEDGIDPVDVGPRNNLTLRVVNTPPTVRISNIRYDGSDVCECGIVTQGDAPRGFTFLVSVTDPSGALGSFSFGGTSGFGNPIPDLFYSDAYSRGREADRQWHGLDNFLIRAGDPWRASRPCAYTFNLAALSRAQDGFQRLFSVQAMASLTILTNRGAGRTDCLGGPEPEAPPLTVRLDGGSYMISWPAEYSDYRFEFTGHPEDPFSWAGWKEPVVIVGDRRMVAFPQGSRPAEFYRLRRLP